MLPGGHSHTSFLKCQQQLCVWGRGEGCMEGYINVNLNMSQSHLDLKEFHSFYVDITVTTMCFLAALSCQVLNYQQHLGSYFFPALLEDRTLQALHDCSPPAPTPELCSGEALLPILTNMQNSKQGASGGTL